MAENPYESPQADTTPLQPSYERLTVTVVITLIAVLAFGALLQFVAICLVFLGPSFAQVNAFLAPRFGWIGLILGLNGCNFLWGWYRHRQPKQLLISALMLLFIGGLNAGQRIVQQSATTPVADSSNPYLQQLPSYWFFAVGTYVLAAAVVLWLWWLQPGPSANEASEPEV